MDNKACKLEAEDEVKARIAALKRAAAEKATTTRAEVLAGMSETFNAGISRIRKAGSDKPLDYTSVNAVTQLGKTLLDALPEETPEQRGEFTRDFALLIGRDFFRPHMLIARGLQTGVLVQGRARLAQELVGFHRARQPHRDAPGRARGGRHEAQEQPARRRVRTGRVGIHEMGLDDEYEMPASTFKIRKRSTGQLIFFAGCDDPQRPRD